MKTRNEITSREVEEAALKVVDLLKMTLTELDQAECVRWQGSPHQTAQLKNITTGDPTPSTALDPWRLQLSTAVGNASWQVLALIPLLEATERELSKALDAYETVASPLD